MSEYIPDAWVVIEFTSGHNTIQKVLAGWSGGYLDGDYWKLSSGITNVVETDTEYIFTNHSGSIYRCYKSSREFNMISAGVYNDFKKQIKDKPDASMELVVFNREI